MSTSPTSDVTPGHSLRIPFVEYVVLSAFLTALTALSIDIMLPALPQIADHFKLGDPNDRQLVVVTYFVGFGVGQLFWGPISDRFGRLPVLTVGLCIFVAGSIVALTCETFEMLLAARCIQGLGSASSRVTVTAIARDLFSGARLSRVMSLIMTVFIVVPVFAPLVGQGLLYIGDWRLPFWVILSAGGLALAWSQLRLPETRPVDLRRSEGNRLGRAVLAFARERGSIAYMIACGLLFGCLLSFIANAQQIFGELFGFGDAFALAFASVALAMSAAAITNARIVLKRGMRPVCHTALLAFVALSIALALVTSQITPPAYVFLPWLASLFYLFGLITPNFNAIVLEPMGDIAGLAASILGFTTTLLAALGGWLIGGAYNGTLFPFALGFAMLSSAALVLVLMVEGRSGMFAKSP